MSRSVILCVDDEKIILISLKEQLRRHFQTECAIETVESGEEALEVAEELLADGIELPVVISDHIMPGLKGDELLKQIHGISPKTLTILLTGQANAEAVGNAVNYARLYRYISKPWEEADLVMTVTEALRSYVQDKKLAEQHALLQQMNQELARLNTELTVYNQTLEQKVSERTQELSATLEKVEEANRKILESIHYAKMIQGSLLPSIDPVQTHLPENFFLWLPRDIVGGDLYFVEITEDDCLLSVIDCTGHGVPGAFMTIIALAGLRRIINDENCREPADILKRLNAFVKTSLRQHTDDALSDDGLDAAVCLIQPGLQRLVFAGANLPLYYVHEGEVHTIKGDRCSVGYKRSDLSFHFTSHTIPVASDMSFYLTSDGFLDQLGERQYRRFGTKQFKELLLQYKDEPFDRQRDALLQAFQTYKGRVEQQDDVTIVGFTVPPAGR